MPAEGGGEAQDKKDKATQSGDDPSESAQKTKNVKDQATSAENETDKDLSDKSAGEVEAANQNADGDALPADMTKVTPSPPVSTSPHLSAETSTETAPSTTPSAVELSPVGPPPAPVSTASTVFETISEKANSQDLVGAISFCGRCCFNYFAWKRV